MNPRRSRLTTGLVAKRLLKRALDLVVLVPLVFSWFQYAAALRYSPSAYSLVSVSLASVGWLGAYYVLRYIWGSQRGHAKPLSVAWIWRSYLTCIAVALLFHMYVHRAMSAAHPVGPSAWALFAVMIGVLVAAGVASVLLVLKGGLSVWRLVSFLAVIGLSILTFSVPYIYCGIVAPTWDVSASRDWAREASSDPKRLGDYIYGANAETLAGIAALYRDTSDPALLSVLQQTPLPLLLDTKCEVANFGSALYFSVLAWTSASYGDYQPAPWARSLVALETLIGYVFMAFLVVILTRFVGDASAPQHPPGDLPPRTTSVQPVRRTRHHRQRISHHDCASRPGQATGSTLRRSRVRASFG